MSYTIVSPTQPYDDALADVLSAVVVGLTGLDPNLVRPRWQPQPPTQPSATTDWCAIGVTTHTGTDFPQWTQDTDLTATLHRLEMLDVLATFYGPHSSTYAQTLRDGLYMWSNHWQLEQSGLKLHGTDPIAHMGEEVNAQEIQRSDLPISLTRIVDSAIASPTVLEAVVVTTGNQIAGPGTLQCTETISNQ
jgi:hypothetical protein